MLNALTAFPRKLKRLALGGAGRHTEYVEELWEDPMLALTDLTEWPELPAITPQVERNFKQTTARWISNVFNPLFGAVYVVIVLVACLCPDQKRIWWWLIATVSLAAIPPLGYIVWLVKRGYAADIHLPERSSRLKPLAAIIAWLGLCALLLTAIHAPAVLALILLAALGQIAALGIITLFWKISFHGTAISAAAATAIALQGQFWAIAIGLLVILVAWARIYLKRHTPWQVVAGCALGSCMILLTISLLWPALLWG